MSADPVLNYCFLLLKFRLRSEKELYSRLKQKKFSEPEIRKAIGFLKEKKFLDDTAFAKAWTDYRLKKGMGSRRIALELALKGIDKQLVSEQLARIKTDYPEAETAMAIARRRKEKMQGLDPQKIRARLYGYLVRRGFSPDIVSDVVSEI